MKSTQEMRTELIRLAQEAPGGVYASGAGALIYCYDGMRLSTAAEWTLRAMPLDQAAELVEHMYGVHTVPCGFGTLWNDAVKAVWTEDLNTLASTDLEKAAGIAAGAITDHIRFRRWYGLRSLADPAYVAAAGVTVPAEALEMAR